MSNFNVLKFSKKDCFLSLAVVAALLAAIFTALLFLSEKDSLVIRQPAFFSQLGEKISCSGTLRLSYVDNEMYLSSNRDDRRFALLNAPLYLEHDDQLILSQVMSYNNPDLNLVRKLNYFASVHSFGDFSSLSLDSNHFLDVKAGFLFDGKNTYIFLEPMSLSLGDDLLLLDTLSFITVVNRKYLYFYSAADDTSGFSLLNNEKILAANLRNTFQLDLSFDLLHTLDGSTQMLIPNPEILPLLE